MWCFSNCLRLLVVLSALSPLTARAEITTQNRVQITQLVRKAATLDRAGDPVEAWRNLSEADRLERLWSGNTLGDDAPAARAWAAYAGELIKREDGGLQKVLHSPRVGLNDKLNLIRRLEQEILINYAGDRGGELLGPGGEE